MKRWILLISLAAVIGLVVWWTLVGLQKQVMIPFDGSPIIADNIRYVGNRIYYRYGGREAWVDLTDINETFKGSWKNPGCYRLLLSAHFQRSLEWLTAAAGPGSGPAAVLRTLVDRIIAFLPQIIGVLIFGFLAYIGIKRGRRFFVKKTKPDLKQEPGTGGHLPQLAGFIEVTTLFLDLYREAIGAPPEAPAKIELVEESVSKARGVYELKIEQDGSWRSRRMTIAAIGENTGSKSQCFYVIFDTHLVVKIPPTPITDFEDYIESIQAEAKIKRKLAPKECVIPNISVILKRIHTFPEARGLSDEHLEARYIRWLLQSPLNQRFLKVGDSFVFFMDLAKSYFLSHVVRSFHRTEDLIAEAAQADTDILTDLNQFEAKYGNPGSDLWPELHQAYTIFHKEIDDANSQSSKAIDLSEWQSKNLFLRCMAGRKTTDLPAEGADRLPASIETLLAQFSEAHGATGRRYRQLLHSYTGERLFDRSHPLMDAMVTNLLALLAWLGEKLVAMRDLKPDNLLVSGNPDEYPQFLSSAESYAIGLIDLETAVDYDRGSHASFLQPRLGGTPFYGTPSHFFPNHLLQEVHEDLALMFHLQDWYAVIGIIYEVVVDQKLFRHTAREIPKMMDTVMQTVRQRGDLKSAYFLFTQRFWESAEAEFHRNLELNASRLDTVSAVIPENLQPRLLENLQAKQSAALARITQCLDATPAFNKGNNRSLLEKSPARDLKRLRDKYADRDNTDDLVCRMDELIGLKREAENLDKRSKTLRTPFPKVTVRMLLQMMFDVTRAQMQAGAAPAVPEKVLPAAVPPDKAAAALESTVQRGEPIEEEGAEAAEGLGYSVTVLIR